MIMSKVKEDACISKYVIVPGYRRNDLIDIAIKQVMDKLGVHYMHINKKFLTIGITEDDAIMLTLTYGDAEDCVMKKLEDVLWNDPVFKWSV